MSDLLGQLRDALSGAQPLAPGGAAQLSSRVTPRATPRELELRRSPAPVEEEAALEGGELRPSALAEDSAEEDAAEETVEEASAAAEPARPPAPEARGERRRSSGWDALLQPGVLHAAAGHKDATGHYGEPDPHVGSPPRTDVHALLRKRMTISRVVAKLHEIRSSVHLEKQESGVQVVHCFNGEDQIGTEFDIPEDSYGAAILAIVKDVHEVYEGFGGALSLVRCCFVLVLLIVNILLQACILSFIATHVVQPAVHHIQADYRDFHVQVFDVAGSFQPHLWRSYDGKGELCQIGMTSRFFYCVLLFVWVTSMLSEFRAGTHLISQVYWMPTCELGSEMLRIDGSGTICIVALTPRTRLLLWGVVCLPKIAISVFLLVLGCKWLSATTSFEALVMNTMAMEFVLHIDELLYEAFLPVAYRRQVADINFFTRHPRKDARQLELEEFASYGKAVSYLCVGVAMVLLWSEYLQSVLPRDISDVKTHCQVYLKSLAPICSHGIAFALGGRSGDCYPFGGADDLERTQSRFEHHSQFR